MIELEQDWTVRVRLGGDATPTHDAAAWVDEVFPTRVKVTFVEGGNSMGASGRSGVTATTARP